MGKHEPGYEFRIGRLARERHPHLSHRRAVHASFEWLPGSLERLPARRVAGKDPNGAPALAAAPISGLTPAQ